MLSFAVTVPSVSEILQKSVNVTQQDWKEAPNFSFIDREVEAKHGHAEHTKTYQVLMIDGSPYNKLIAINDVSLSMQEQQQEAQKLEREIDKRQHESNADRKRRISKYVRQRNQDRRMLTEMVKAFQYSLVSEDKLAGHKVWVLNATPKQAYVPHNREGRILQRMRGNLWVDQSTYHWVKVEAQVVKPVSMFGFLAKVKPGTRFELVQAPVTGAIWQPRRFLVNVEATALGFLNENSHEEDTYRDYRPMSETMAQLLGTKASPVAGN